MPLQLDYTQVQVHDRSSCTPEQSPEDACSALPRTGPQNRSVLTRRARERAAPKVSATGPLRTPSTHSPAFLAPVAPQQLTWCHLVHLVEPR